MSFSLTALPRLYNDRLTCVECGSDDLKVNGDGYMSCCACGLVDSTYSHFIFGSFDPAVPIDNRRKPVIEEETIDEGVSLPLYHHRRSRGCDSSKGRYKPVFHFRERLAQLSCVTPPMPLYTNDRIMAKAREKAPYEEYTRADVIGLLKELKLSHYQERAKSILTEINPHYYASAIVPHSYLLERIEPIFSAVEVRFNELAPKLMAPSLIRKKDGSTKVQPRKNFPSYYFFKKDIRGFGRLGLS